MQQMNRKGGSGMAEVLRMKIGNATVAVMDDDYAGISEAENRARIERMRRTLAGIYRRLALEEPETLRRLDEESKTAADVRFVL